MILFVEKSRGKWCGLCAEKLFWRVKKAICFRFVRCGIWGETLPHMRELTASNKSNTGGRVGFEATQCWTTSQDYSHVSPLHKFAETQASQDK